MELATLLLFVPACFAFDMTPGPNNLLSLSNATRYGFRLACLAGLGRLLAFAVMIALTSLGLTIVLKTSELLFAAIKIVGAAYLFLLAVQLWRALPVDDAARKAAPRVSLFALARGEFFVAAGNPKAILFFTAFLPQFVNPQANVSLQFLWLGSILLLLEWLAIAIYASMGLHFSRWFAQARNMRSFNRACATLFVGAGLGLLGASRS